jgi:hypothetical protein
MKKIVTICSLFSFIFFSCGKQKYDCGETAGVERSYLGLSFFSISNSKYMYSAGVPSIYSLYNKDSLIITDATGLSINLIESTEQVPNENKLYYKFTLTPVYNSSTDGIAYTQEINRKFYIQYNSTERDTLICTFKVNKNECNSYLEYLKIYYRNNLIGNSNDGLGCNLIINKP